MICCFLQKVPTRTIMSDWLVHIIILYSPVLGYHMLHIENNCITHTSHDILIDWIGHISQEATTGTSTPVPYHQVESPPPIAVNHGRQILMRATETQSHDRKDRGTATGKGHPAAYRFVLCIILIDITHTQFMWSDMPHCALALLLGCPEEETMLNGWGKSRIRAPFSPRWDLVDSLYMHCDLLVVVVVVGVGAWT